MIESKFRMWVMLPAGILIILLNTIIFFLTRDYSVLTPNTPFFFKAFFSIFFVYFVLSLFWGELRTKAVKLYIDDKLVVKKDLSGWA